MQRSSVHKSSLFTEEQPNLLPIMLFPKLRLEADVAPFIYWKMLLFCTSNSCLPYYCLCACRLGTAFWWRTTLPFFFLVLHYAVNAFSIQTSVAAGQLVGVASIAHLTCFHGRPFQTTWRRSEITALFVHLRMHAALLIAVQCLLHPAPWFSRHLVSVHLLPAAV